MDAHPQSPTRSKRTLRTALVVIGAVGVLAMGVWRLWPTSVDCASLVDRGFLPVAEERDHRFLGKVKEDTASCRGGAKAVALRGSPWVDWQNYYGTGDGSSRSMLDVQNTIGVLGALSDLEYQRIELIRFNLWDNNKTFSQYVLGRDGVPGASLRTWPEMRLPTTHPNFTDVSRPGGEQRCGGELIRFRTLTGICNDMRNPAMGSTHALFSRMVEFEATFPDAANNQLAKNRHGGRISLLQPDPQVISRKLFSRIQSDAGTCRAGLGLEGDAKGAQCDYQKANSFNVLAAFWIQFMTHDWFSHLEEGHNAPELMSTGCQGLSAESAHALGCRADDKVDRAYIADAGPPGTFDVRGEPRLDRAYQTTRNNVTAWWDGSQLYGYDEASRERVKRDPKDRARFLLVRQGAGRYLPVLGSADPMHPAWKGQEATAFADNWNIGLSFYHNVFAREHNAFVDAFRRQQGQTPEADCGLRHPSRPDQVVRYKDVTADELFEIARLVVSAEIAKIHTIEWTTQLLYNEPLYLGMNANWSGLLGDKDPQAASALRKVVAHIGESERGGRGNALYSVFAAGPGIVGLGSHGADPNGGVNHFGSPFNFPEEFITVYRLHPLVPDLIEFRDLRGDPNAIRKKIAVAKTFRGLATDQMRSGGLANWALSMGRQRTGALTLHNHPLFLQNLPMPRLNTRTNMLDVAALDLLRDRERGVPRFNEFRRQLGLKQLTGFDDFIDPHLTKDDPARAQQVSMVGTLREVYGRHRCDARAVITDAQLNDDGSKINDCLGHPDGSMVDNIEDLDTVVGWLAEFTRPHGFAISETQFHVFIINASRRLFSDRFFTSSFRPAFYTQLGYDWVNNNGPDGKVVEKGKPNGHEQEVSPLKRVLLRTIPELQAELDPVINVFDPWARQRGEYYALTWKPRPGAEADEAFKR